MVSSDPPATQSGRLNGAYVHGAVGFAVAVAALWYIQSGTTGIIDPDGYYHIRWSRLLWENLPAGRLPRFVWLPLTTLNEHAYVDHHFLFHVLQIPFTWLPDLVASAKTSAVVYGAIAIAACYLLVVWGRVPYAPIWLLALLACSGPFLFRMSLPRAPAVTVATLALALGLLWTRRYVAYGVLTFALVWMYSLFPLAGVLAAAWAVGVLVEERRVEWRPVVFAGIGMIVGLLVNPYFPENLILFWDHVKMKTAGEYEVAVGNEWYPYETWYLVISSIVAWVAQLAGTAAMRPERRSGAARVVCLFLVSTFMFVLTLKSRRFIEYWPAFAVLFCAFSLGGHLERFSWDRLRGFVARGVATAAVGAVALVLASAVFVNVRETRRSVEGESGAEQYAGAARWMAANTPAGSMVFNTDWDDFPMLFHFDTHNVYASGLDPTYLLHADRELSKLYEDITLGKVENPGPQIRDRFGARFAFTDTGHTDFIRHATDGGMKVVYEDRHAMVFEIPEQGPAAGSDEAGGG